MPVSIYGERSILIPDPNWQPAPVNEDEETDQQPPLISVPNPNCSLPPEEQLHPLCDEEYETLMSGLSRGQVIDTDSLGRPFLIDPPPLSKSQLQAQQALNQINLVKVATANKTALAERIATLEDAVANIGQPEMESFAATAEEQAELIVCQSALIQWKNYAIALGRIVPTGAPIDWPSPPVSQ